MNRGDFEKRLRRLEEQVAKLDTPSLEEVSAAFGRIAEGVKAASELHSCHTPTNAPRGLLTPLVHRRSPIEFCARTPPRRPDSLNWLREG